MNSKIMSISEKVNKVYSGCWIIIVFMSITTIFGMVQCILFATNVISINGTTINDESNLVTLAWIATIISLISCYTGFVGSIQNIRGSNSFLIWMTIQLSLLSIVAMMAGALFASISSLFGLVSAYVRYFVWKYELIKNKVNKKQLALIAFLTWIVIALLFTLIVSLFSDTSDMWDQSEPNHWLWYMDAIGASLEICAYTFLIFKVWWAFLFFLISKFFFGIIYGMTGNMVSMIQMLLFATTDISGILGWLYLSGK